MPSRPWYRWNPSDHLADTLHLTSEQEGIYRRLLDALWIHGPITDSNAIRARFARESSRKMRSVWTTLSEFFEVENGQFDHPRIRKERDEMIEIVEKRRAAGKRGGLAKAKQSSSKGGSKQPSKTPSKTLARARDQILDKRKDNPVPSPTPARAREDGDPLTPEERAQAERLQAVLEDRRRVAGVASGGPAAVVDLAASVVSRVEDDEEEKT